MLLLIINCKIHPNFKMLNENLCTGESKNYVRCVRAQSTWHCLSRLFGERVKRIDSRVSLLAVLIQELFCEGVPGDSDGLPSLETGP